MKIVLENVSYEEKDVVKSLGAKWNPIDKHWYIENQEDLMPFANWIPSIYGFYKLHSSDTKLETKKSTVRRTSKRLNERQWLSRKRADMKKRPAEYSYLNSDGFIQCKAQVFKVGDEVEVYHFGLWRATKITTDGKDFYTALGIEAVNQRIRFISEDRAIRASVRSQNK